MKRFSVRALRNASMCCGSSNIHMQKGAEKMNSIGSKPPFTSSCPFPADISAMNFSMMKNTASMMMTPMSLCTSSSSSVNPQWGQVRECSTTADTNPMNAVQEKTEGNQQQQEQQQSKSSNGSSSDYTTRCRGFIKRNWFTMSLPLLLAFTSQFPDLLRSEGIIGFNQQMKDFFVIGIFLSSGLALPLAKMGAAVRAWPLQLFIQGWAFIGVPAVVSLLAGPLLRDGLGLPDPIVTGFLILSTLPVSIGISLALTRVGNGNVAATLLNSAVSNLSGVIITPFVCLWVTGATASLDMYDIVTKLTMIVALPAMFGVMLRHRAPQVVSKGDAVYGITQPLCLLPLLGNVFSNAFHNHQQQAKQRQLESIVAEDNTSSSVKKHTLTSTDFVKVLLCAAGLNALLMGSIYASSAIFVPKCGASRVAAVITASQKTGAMGVPMISVMFSEDPNVGLMTLPLLCYHPIQAGLGGVAAATMRRRLALPCHA